MTNWDENDLTAEDKLNKKVKSIARANARIDANLDRILTREGIGINPKSEGAISGRGLLEIIGIPPIDIHKYEKVHCIYLGLNRTEARSVAELIGHIGINTKQVDVESIEIVKNKPCSSGDIWKDIYRNVYLFVGIKQDKQYVLFLGGPDCAGGKLVEKNLVPADKGFNLYLKERLYYFASSGALIDCKKRI